MDAKILPLTNQDIKEVVNVHIRAFPGFFLTFLGPKFLKVFYNSFTYNTTGIGFVAENSVTGKVLGVIVGPLVPDGYFKRLLKKRWWAFCLASFTAILKRPAVVKRLFRALFYSGQAPQGSKRALLSSIAVDPEAQGQGVGRSLVERWVEEVRLQGGKGCYLTTDAENNEKINTFYRKLGWKINSTYVTPEGRKMNRYVFDFGNQREC